MLLAIGTAHRACSLALIEAGQLVRHVHEDIGRGHAERLIPMISELVGADRPSHIVVEIGPGSFTGIRVGVAAARALGLAWRVPVSGMTSTALLAAQAFGANVAADRLAVILDGGRGEVFVQHFDRHAGADGDVVALPRADVVLSADAAIGTGAGLIDLPPATVMLGNDVPNAASAALLAETDRSLPPTPLYVRAPDAKPPQRSFTA